MKPNKSAYLVSTFASLAFIGTGHAALVTGPWSVAQGGGPVTGGNTASPIVGDGTNNSADTDAIYSSMPTITLASVGDKVTLSGSVELIGITNGAVRQFRWGLYDANGSSDTTGWLGYFATQGSGATGGEIYDRNANSSTYFATGTGIGTTVGSAPGAGITFTSSTYAFSLTIERVLTGMQVESSITRTSDSQHFGIVSLLDATANVQTDTFDRVGFLLGGAMDADQAVFSNIDVTFVPEPGSAALGLIGSILLLRRRRA